MLTSKRILEAIEDITESETIRVSMALGEILNLLFWKDYSAGYVKLDDRQKLIKMIDTYNYVEGNPEFGGYYKFDNVKELDELINKIRVTIGLDKLPFKR